ncbi:MAG: tyrosine protein phosphatase [Chloroflexi bacterium]|nr:tyrosine protein phosphatase [Chloroflexota bacterium]
MYDLHVHILPGLDDGARTMQEAVEMARVAAECGTKVLLATPHMKDVNEESSVGQARSLLNELSKRVEEANIPITLVMGMENHVVPSLPAMFSRGEALVINGTKYALIEMPFFGKPAYLEQTLFDVQLQGIVPVLAHPERIECIQQDVELLVRFVERGMLSQITAGSLTGHFGSDVQRFTEDLLRRNLAHIMASDTHRPDGRRSPSLLDGLTAATEIAGNKVAQALVLETPKAILKGSKPKLTPPIHALKRRWWQIRR